MAKIIPEAYYECDRCNKQSKLRSDMATTDIPTRMYGDSIREYTRGERGLMLCHECYREYWDLCINHFAEVSEFYGTITVEKKSLH